VRTDDVRPVTLTDPDPTLVTTATSQPALGLVSLLDLPRRRDRVLALSGAAAAGWYLVRGGGFRAVRRD
jgi:malonyl CoA-acyl carrier protein transacylase